MNDKLLSPPQTLILSKVDVKMARSIILPGDYEQAFEAEVVGKIKVGEETEAQVPVPWKEIALGLLAGHPPSAALKLVQEALNMPKDEDLEKRVTMRVHPLLGKVPRAGSVTGTVIVRVTR